MGRKPQPPQKNKHHRNNKLVNNAKELQENVDKLLRISTIPQQTNVNKALENQKEISAIVEKVKSLELNKNHNNDRTSSADNSANGDLIDEFTKWARENGAEFKGCSIAEFEGFDLGLKVNTDVPKNSLVIAVPRKLMLSVETANRSALRSLIEKDQILKNMPNVVLAMFLLLEKHKENSFWKPYIDILPKKYSTVLYFNVEELEELRGSPTLEIALRQIKSIVRQYAYFYKLFNTSDDAVSRILRSHFTYNEYCWAVSTIMTRQNTIPSENGSQMINALIPLWDLCNHTNGTISTDYNPALDRSECLALRDFKKGEQLFIFYGARSNADLFIHNGFVYEDNEHDSYWIRLGISKSDPLQEKRTELLRRLEIQNMSDFSLKKGPQPIDGKLLAFVRVFNMNEEQLQHWLESEKSSDLQYIECALDTALEKKSWSFLQARLKLILMTYKTSLEEDLKLLQNTNNSTPNKLLAIRMRVTEKRIIKDSLEYVEQYIKQ